MRRATGLITADYVRDVRRRTGLSPAEFAAILGVRDSTVYRWEQRDGRIEPHSQRLLAAIDLAYDRGLTGLRGTLITDGPMRALYAVLRKVYA